MQAMSAINKRICRVSLVTALSLAIAYGLGLELPFITPLFAFLLALNADKPIALKGLLGLLLVISITLGSGLLLIPMLNNYPMTGLFVVALGIFFSAHLLVNLGKTLVGTFFMAGITMISSVGSLSFAVALTMVDSILTGVFIAILCQWLVFPFFAIPATKQAEQSAESTDTEVEHTAALRTTAIVFPVYLLALTNPSLYLPLMMKSVTLGQQSSVTDLHKAGGELLLSTLAGGALAIILWALLKIHPDLWVFFLGTLLLSMWCCRRLFAATATRFTPSFWQNAMVTLFILIGPAVQDTINGKDPYRAFIVRMSLFIALSAYAWFAARLIEHLREGRRQRHTIPRGAHVS